MSVKATGPREDRQLKLLLMGNPNVGKSVVFSKLTGLNVESSNFTGTTVDYTLGDLNFFGRKGKLIDVPGTYSLAASSEAEKLAVDLVEAGADAIICVLDATHLARNLDLALELKKYNIPIVYSLNLMDVAERQGIKIDVDRLSEILEAPVVPTVAIRNVGLNRLVLESYKLIDSREEGPSKTYEDEEERWQAIGLIIDQVQTRVEREEGFIDRLEDASIRPWPGIPLAILVLLLSLGVVVGGGKAIRSLLLLPLMNNIIKPFIVTVVSALVSPGMLRNILVGDFGVLIIGIEWPLALIMPYVLLFYIVFSFLEDSGFLPRIGVLADGLLRKIGIQGGNIVSLMMGYGCAVPAIIGTRAATTYKERIMVASLIAFAIPCVSQTGAFIALLGDRSILALLLVYLISFLAMALVGSILNKLLGGETQPMLLEVPNILLPDRDAFKTKLKLRMRHFLVDARGPMMLGILIAAIVAETGILNSFSQLIAPLVEGWLGLPKEASLALLLGIVRRELAVLPLLELDLTTLQLLTGSVVALFYLPCLSVFGVLAEEFSVKIALLIAFFSMISAFVIAGLVNNIGLLILGLV